MIRTHSLCYRHPSGNVALHDVEFRLDRGEYVALIGANGSGKTTLARCLNGLLSPTSGSVEVDGISSATDTGAQRIRLVGMVFQNPDDQLVAPTAESEIAFGLENYGVAPVPMRERIEDMLQRFDLLAYRTHPPHLLSGGQRQRLAIASSIALRPRYLVLDEPTSLLDAAGRRRVLDLLPVLCSEHDIGVLHVTQSAEEACLADHVLCLHAGRLVADGTPRQVLSGHDHRTHLPFALRISRQLNLSEDTTPLTLTELADQLIRRPQPTSTGPAQPSLAKRQGPPLFATDRVWHTYTRGLKEPIHALRDLSVSVNGGVIVGLLGGSGSGKTTFAQHLNGLLRPTQGRITHHGREVPKRLSHLRRKVGLVFQFPEAQLFEETVAADIAFGPRQLGLSDSETEQRVRWSLSEVGLLPESFMARSPFTLSGGERRRAAIAGVIAMQTDTLVLDEPTAGLDGESRDILMDLFRRHRERGGTVVLISHDMDLVAELADDLIVLCEGELAGNGTPHDLLGDPEQASRLGLELPRTMVLRALLHERGWRLPAILTESELLQSLHIGEIHS
ncbi:MAG: energy-coupling factor transporter ATPase [Candidatus Latescibacterota bacterium]|nr:energy-coupling factor transporter ATPase [Candidatus Latescibacterota bacterium]